MPTIHLISGPVGVGKTTYALKLAKEIGAVRFSIDDWMTELFFPDMPDPMTYEWAVERAKRCEARIQAVSLDILATGKDVIWDIGLMEFDQRKRILANIAPTPYETHIHALDAPIEVRRQRVRQRNIEKPEGYAMTVSDDIFDFMEERSTPVADDETTLITRVDTAKS